MTTTTERPTRVRRCRYHDRQGNPCPNPSLDQDAATIDICWKHAARVMELIKEAQVRAQRATRAT